MATATPPTFTELNEHLTEVLSNPSTSILNVRLLETFTAQLPEQPTTHLTGTLVPLLAKVLAVVNEDPTPITTLLQHLLTTTTFTELLAFASQPQTLQLLSAASPAVRILGLSILEKAAAAPSEVGIVASWSDVVQKLVEVLLCDSDTGVASRAADVLVKLLAADLGVGLLWRRIFEDEGVYGTFFRLCSWKGEELPEGKKAKTEAQGRLLQVVARMAALDFSAVSTSAFPAIDKKYAASEEACGGLLEFAARWAVDADGDVMMHMVLLDFYTLLLQSTKALDYLETSGLHGATAGRYIAPAAYSDDIIDQQLLESKAAEYLATYARLHPTKLFDSPAPKIPDGRNPKRRRMSLGTGPPPPAKTLIDVTLERIEQTLKDTPQHPHTPSMDILMAMPPSVLVTDLAKKVVAMIPLSPPQTAYIDALTAVITKQGSSSEVYDNYYATHTDMWQKINSYVSTLALRDVVLACMNFIEKLLVAQDSTGTYWGAKEIVNAPNVMAFLITPPQRFSGARDPMSTAFVVATRKLEVLETVLRVLGRAGDEVPGAEGWKVVVQERLKVGLWGNGAGGEVATMEM
ncbi:uncharacterized protein LAJ45_08228 [Morchella importuna]|uniref:DNA mismatch repair protein HSM3 N-terminal domain-containing protein n=1 Tax=Morchella conica CCBAS932 TaxID=1392247 RepID=A0A3N4KII2_9PEZI|nr:uncharacterized protein LAJ45_08228 [Morchella importuna]KAH8147762.1 hypothetical protein LAJ45_08228 [Morchella importuna]RPB10374.1 hypothetical protein P167DRAFT_509242 [Morchella conica CCBAS932]